jgi:hypothetical protein
VDRRGRNWYVDCRDDVDDSALFASTTSKPTGKSSSKPTLSAAFGGDDDEQLEGPRPAQRPAAEDAMQLDGACCRGGVERPATPEAAQAAQPPALQLASLRHALDDVDD